MWNAVYILLGGVFHASIVAPSLNHCGGSSDDRFAEVIRGSANNTFTCTLATQDTGSELEWRVQWFPTEGGKQSDDGAGRCPSPPGNTDTCTDNTLLPVFIPSRTSGSQSVMTVNTIGINNERLITHGTLVCRTDNGSEDSCPMDYITPASGTCSTTVMTSSSPWRLSTSCTITQGQSSRGRYQCQGSYRTQGTSQDSWSSPWVDMNPNLLPTGTARCPFQPVSLPDKDGTYSFRVRLRPGRQYVGAGTVQLRRPSTPSTSCSPSPVPENTNVSCTCTANVGQPAGRLRWLSGSSNNFNPNSPLVTGDSPLTLSRRLTRNDHDVTQFRCDVLWSDDVKSSGSYTADVGFPPSSVEVKINSSVANPNKTVKEHDDVTFTCNAIGGNPAADVTLSGPGLTSIPVTSQVPHVVPNAQCESGGVYSCRASNGYSPAVTASVTLLVSCKPRRDNDNIGEINFNDEAESVSFDVTAHPAPTKVSFSFLGPDGTRPPSTTASSISLSGQCVKKGQSLFTSTCTVTVNNITMETAAGVYRVTVTNTVGVGNFSLTVKYRAPTPPPSSSQVDTAPIIGGVVGVIILAVVVVVLVFIVIKRRKAKKQEGLVKVSKQGNSVEIDDFAPPTSLHMSPHPKGPPPDQPSAGKEVDAFQPQQAANGASPSDEYAVVKKKPKEKKETPKAKPPKAAAERKQKKGKKDGPIYGNIPAGADAKKPSKKQDVQGEKDTGRTVNQDGLIYVDVNIPTAKKTNAPPKPAAAAGEVEYSTVDFQRTK